MDGKKYLVTIDAALKNARLLTVAFGISMAFNVLSWYAWYKVKAHNQVVVIPIGSEGMQVGNGKADPRYMRRMARYITNQVGTYTASTARLQYQELLDLFPADRVTGAAGYFDALAADIERYPSIASAVSFAGNEPVRYTKDLMQVRVMKERIVNGVVTERKQVHYCLNYRIEDTRFWLVNITEKEEASVDPCMPKVDADGRPVPDKPAAE